MIVASIYLPNGNPIGTEKFDYKLRWMDRLRERAATILAEGTAGGAGRRLLQSSPRIATLSRAGRWRTMRCSSRKARRPSAGSSIRAGPTRCALNPDEDRLYTFWDYTAGAWPRDAGFRIDHLLCSPQAADRLRGAEVHKWARGEEKASDHAPVAIELA